MRTRAKRRVTVRFTWDRLKVSFWFAPLVMSLGAILLDRAVFWVDVRIPMKCYRITVSSCLVASLNCVVR